MRIPYGRIAVLVAPLLFFAALVGATQSADAATTAYEIASDHTTTCIVDNGGSVFLQGCPTNAALTNHAGLWYAVKEGVDSSNGQTMYLLENVHNSGSCLTMNDSGGVYMATCSTNHVEFWEFTADPGGGYQAVRNVHTGLYLTDSGDPVWHFISTSV